jgi:hypothetical protein
VEAYVLIKDGTPDGRGEAMIQPVVRLAQGLFLSLGVVIVGILKPDRMVPTFLGEIWTWVFTGRC